MNKYIIKLSYIIYNLNKTFDIIIKHDYTDYFYLDIANNF